MGQLFAILSIWSPMWSSWKLGKAHVRLQSCVMHLIAIGTDVKLQLVAGCQRIRLRAYRSEMLFVVDPLKPCQDRKDDEAWTAQPTGIDRKRKEQADGTAAGKEHHLKMLSPVVKAR